MQDIKCSWTVSNDSFLIETPHIDFASWFVRCCHDHGNNFGTVDSVYKPGCRFIDELINDLETCVEVVNGFLLKIKEPTILIPQDIEHQNSLNQLHKDWIRVHRNRPGIDNLMYKIDIDLFDRFHKINDLIHAIESRFTYDLKSQPYWQEQNPFDLCNDWNEYAISINYTDFGKSSYEKWNTRDTNPNDHELNQWTHIGSSLHVDLNNSRPGSAPKDFLAYCNRHKIVPVPPRWPLGNLVDAHADLGQIRRMFNRNLQIKNNFLCFDLM